MATKIVQAGSGSVLFERGITLLIGALVYVGSCLFNGLCRRNPPFALRLTQDERFWRGWSLRQRPIGCGRKPCP